MAQPAQEKDVLSQNVFLQTQLVETIGKIKASSIKQIITRLKANITKLLSASAITIYIVDANRGEIYSLAVEGTTSIREFRLPLSTSSVAGYAAFRRTLVNIADVYDPTSLRRAGDGLAFDDSWDKKSGFRTKQILAVPFFYDGNLMGVIQVLNMVDDEPFNELDIALAQRLGEALGKKISEKGSAISGLHGKFYHLIAEGVIGLQDLQIAFAEARKDGSAPEEILMHHHRVSKEKIGAVLSWFYRCRFIAFEDDVSDVGDKIPLDAFHKDRLLRDLWFPLGHSAGVLYVVVDDPADINKRATVEHFWGTKNIKFFVSLKGDIERFIKRAFDAEQENVASLSDILASGDKGDDDAELAVIEAEGVVVRVVNKIIMDACRMRASDIHIEPDVEKSEVGVRLRIDGDCHLYQTLPYSYRKSLVSRIKVMSNLDTTNRLLPQDGKIKINIAGGKAVELRVATLPTQGETEDVVMRILRKDESIPPISRLHLSERDEKEFLAMLEKPHGLILVVGPTGQNYYPACGVATHKQTG